MADVMPDYRLEIVKIKAGIAALTSNLQNYRREIVEQESRKGAARANIAATKKAISEQQATLASLIKTHGDVSDEEIDEASEG